MFSTCPVVYSVLNPAPRGSLFELSLGLCSLLESYPRLLPPQSTLCGGLLRLCLGLPQGASEVRGVISSSISHNQSSLPSDVAAFTSQTPSGSPSVASAAVAFSFPCPFSFHFFLSYCPAFPPPSAQQSLALWPFFEQLLQDLVNFFDTFTE